MAVHNDNFGPQQAAMVPAVIAGKQSTQELGTKARNIAFARHDP
jgi:hypothetical protein